MQSSIGSDAFALLAILCISLFVLLLLRHFIPLRSTPAYLIIPVFLALALPVSIILLVPIDIASSSRTEDVASRGEYVDSGYRSPRDRFFYSLKQNGRYQLIVLVCAGLGGIYVFLVNGFQTGSLKSLVMA
ncbi:MAG: hypothetical protein OHK93_005953 [Ramalina farinacea]|uniref:Uncharacterized protein n=1 Tax=Ramalina farinacea TaxID=258253 RepID=A0AA43TSJ6_9LECA|nr:hypothetical protein [Ramalina farinacea]